MPAARGAEADVPVCDSVHFCRRSVVTCKEEYKGRSHSGARAGKAEPPCTSFSPKAPNSGAPEAASGGTVAKQGQSCSQHRGPLGFGGPP